VIVFGLVIRDVWWFLRRFLWHSEVLASLQSRFDGRPGHQSNIEGRDLNFLGGKKEKQGPASSLQ
jgi:hypothetical protein